MLLLAMVTITVGNSVSKINNLPVDLFNKLRKLLSYTPNAQAAYFSGGFVRPKHCVDKYGHFDTGLIYRVKAFLAENKIKYAWDLNAPKKPTRLVDHKANFGSIKPYEDQLKAVEAVLKNHRGILSMVTGSGKSLVAALLASRLSVRTLIVVPSLEIKTQLTESFKAIFGAMPYIRIENIDSKALKTLTDFDLLIIDEAHHVASKTYHKLNRTAWKDIYYRVMLTATPFRNQTEETLLFEGIAGQVIFDLPYLKAVKKGYVARIEAFYIEMPKQATEAYTWSQVYSELVVNHAARNQKIADIMTTLHEAKQATLCLVKEVKHGENIAALTGGAFANGKDDDTRAYIKWFSSGKLKSLIGTTGILGEGVDSKPCEWVIIAGLGKAKSAFIQQVGRAIRTYPGKESGKVIIIKDRSHRFTVRHFNEQCKILLEIYGIKPIRLDL